MGTSHPETKPWVVERVLASGARRVLDVGAGSGGWLEALRAAGFTGVVDAVEVWAPYVAEFGLVGRYGTVYTEDARTFDGYAGYDVVILGDVVEHMPKDDALALVARIGSVVPFVAIALPIIHYCQGALNGNPYEVHVKDDWSHGEVLASFPAVVESQPFSVTGAYWLGF